MEVSKQNGGSLPQIWRRLCARHADWTARRQGIQRASCPSTGGAWRRGITGMEAEQISRLPAHGCLLGDRIPPFWRWFNWKPNKTTHFDGFHICRGTHTKALSIVQCVVCRACFFFFWGGGELNLSWLVRVNCQAFASCLVCNESRHQASQRLRFRGSTQGHIESLFLYTNLPFWELSLSHSHMSPVAALSWTPLLAVLSGWAGRLSPQPFTWPI